MPQAPLKRFLIVGGRLGDRGVATARPLCQPQSVAVVREDSLCITDVHGNRVRKVDPAGIITTVAGNSNRVTPAMTA